MKKQDITKVLNSISTGLKAKEIELYKAILEKGNFKLDNIKNISDFDITFLYPYHKFLSGYIGSEISRSSDVEFILLQNSFLEQHFSKLFERFEGRTCSVDKSSTVMHRLMVWFKDGKKIEFDYKSEYTFMYPKKVLKTHQEILSFYEALKSLYYGNPTDYLLCFHNLIENNKK